MRKLLINLRLLKQRIAKRNYEQGAAAMEMALLLPIFVLIVCGVVEFGDIWYIHHSLTNASREGARFGIRHPGTFPRNPCPTQAAIANIIKGPNGYLREFSRFGDCSDVTVVVPSPPCTAGADLTVTVSYPKDWLLLGPLIGLESVTITATTTMKLE